MQLNRTVLAIAGLLLLVVAYRVGSYVYGSEYLVDARGNPIPVILAVFGVAILWLAATQSSESIDRRTSRSLRLGAKGAAAAFGIAVASIVLLDLPPQGGLWVVFAGPAGFVLGAIVGLLAPPKSQR
jgi:hypothetical protein